MLGIWLENQKLSIRDNLPVPALPAGEALVRVRLAGICATDLELVRGYYPYQGIPGHEFVGEIIAAPGDPTRVGQRVVGEINAVCGNCAACSNGRPTHCERRTVLGIAGRDGAFAEYLTLPLANLHVVPESVPDEVAVFTEPLAAALEIQQQVQVQPTNHVLVVGAGRLGQLVAQTLALTGCDLQVLARHPNQCRLLVERGIHLIDESEIEPREMDIVVEATGSPSGFDMARRAIRPRGTLVLKSTYAGKLDINFSSVVVDELTLVGSRCGPFEPALRLLAVGEVEPRPLIEAEFSLRDGLAAFECSSRPGKLKVLLRPN